MLVQDLTGNAAVESGTTGGRAGIVIAKIEYQLLRRAALVGVVTPRFGDVLIRYGVDEAKVVSLPNFTHTRAVDATPADARRRLGWSIDRFTVVHTGNMGMKQGLESVIEAAGLAERSGADIDFVLVGDGNQRQRLERAGRGTSCLRFVDPLSTADYPYALAAADVLILNERPGVVGMSMPSKLTSYCNASRPIVAAVEPGGITYSVLMADRAAEVVPPGSGDTLLAAVRELRADAARREELVVTARAMHLSRYGAHAAFERYRDFARPLARSARLQVSFPRRHRPLNCAEGRVVQVPRVGRGEPVGQFDGGRPSESGDLGNVEDLAGGAVRLGVVELDRAPVTDRPRDDLGDLADGDVAARSYVDRLRLVVVLEQEQARSGQVVHVQELTAGGAGAPHRDGACVAVPGLVEATHQCRQDVRGLRVEVVSGPVQVGGHGRGVVQPVLAPQCLHVQHPGDLGDGVGVVGGFEGPVSSESSEMGCGANLG